MEKKSLGRLIQEAIDEGATTVEEIHKSIAALPLKILEDADLLPQTTKAVRRVQDHTIGAIYDVIRAVNEKVGKLASDILAKAREGGGPRHAEHPKKRTAAAAAH
jgi:hypothetical protein